MSAECTRISTTRTVGRQWSQSRGRLQPPRAAHTPPRAGLRGSSSKLRVVHRSYTRRCLPMLLPDASGELDSPKSVESHVVLLPVICSDGRRLSRSARGSSVHFLRRIGLISFRIVTAPVKAETPAREGSSGGSLAASHARRRRTTRTTRWAKEATCAREVPF